MAEAHAMVSLVEKGWADQSDVARAFGCAVRTVRRYQRRFEDGGLSALGHGSGYPKGRRRLKDSRTKLVPRLKAEGHSNRETARRIGVSEKAVRKLLRRMGWREKHPEQALLPLGEVPACEPKPVRFFVTGRSRALTVTAWGCGPQTCPLFAPPRRNPYR